MPTAEIPPSRSALEVSRHIRVPLEEFEFTYTRSSGPGGQNVNKVNSKAQLRWPVTRSAGLPEPVRQRFLARYANRVTAEGDVLITSQRFRDQARNVDDCLDKLRGMIAEVIAPPTPRKRTRPTRGSVKRRLDNKRRTAEKKENRRHFD
ncbi:MAG TPA: alternative ribosome rescue aminoacyl-tRNA hydrolase ArfB [Pirellulales bacterium]|nr:alternative ribosome rescue aminoacyl-tRNA hydrolase ArfB [Pirellulales bacterium]